MERQVIMNRDIEMSEFSGIERKLWSLENHPYADAYFKLAYQAIMDGDINLGKKYFSKTVEALEHGHALTVLNGQKPLDKDYDCSKRAVLQIVS
jgi:hypothetical protein